jgi:hypothetical protein
MTSYHLDHAAFRELVLNAPWMVEEMHSRAESAKAVAVSISPDAPVIGEGYIDSFEVESGTHGGVNHDRAYAVLKNTSDHARYVEFGTEHNAAHHVLTRAMDGAGGA